MADVIFANVTDPLTLGTLYTCYDEGGAGGSEVEDMKNIKNATGGHLQGNARNLIENITPKFYLHSGATLLTAGSTVAGYFVDSCVPGKTNEGHDTMEVRCHKRTAGAYQDTVVS